MSSDSDKKTSTKSPHDHPTIEFPRIRALLGSLTKPDNLASESASHVKAVEAARIVQYECVCGAELKVQNRSEEPCSKCGRRIPWQAIERAESVTMTITPDAESTSIAAEIFSEDDPFIGKMLGHFRLDSPVGRGGMGRVYRALDTSLMRYVAVKVVCQATGGSISSNARIETIMQEAVAQARLNHPYVATIYYVGRQDDEPFMAMELLTGGTLADRIADSPLPYQDAIRFTMQIVLALAHAEEYELIHADIKPSNLLITKDENIKLSDFGLARVAKKNDGRDKVSGTPAYFAPELAEGASVSNQSDMYALGVTLFEMLFGRYPFELSGRTIHEKLRSHATIPVEYPVPWPKSVPIEVKPLLDRLLAKKPSDRFEDYSQLRSAVLQLQPTTSITAGVPARAIAFILDQSLLLLTIVPFLAIFFFGRELLNETGFEFLSYIIPLLWYSIPVLLLIIIRAGWRTPGGALFQLRTKDEHGLPLSRNQRMCREALRSLPMFLAMVTLPISSVWMSLYVMPLCDLAGLVFLGVNVFVFLSSGFETALHDRLVSSRLTLDTGRRKLTNVHST
jgi:serine/threonine protein kinase